MFISSKHGVISSDPRDTFCRPSSNGKHGLDNKLLHNQWLDLQGGHALGEGTMHLKSHRRP